MANLRLTQRILFTLDRRNPFTRLLSDEAAKRSWSTNNQAVNDQKTSPYTIKLKTIKPKLENTNTNRVLTVPNVLTLSRIATAPAMGYFIINGMHSQALMCFAYAATTDLVDGWIARTFKQNSDVGALLDPIADKILLATCFIAMYNAGIMPLWIIKCFVFRDLFLLLGGAFIRRLQFDETPSMSKYFDFKNHPSIGFQPTMLSKCNTALQCLLIVTHLSTNHLAGDFYYDWLMFGFHGLTFMTAAFSMTQYSIRFFGH